MNTGTGIIKLAQRPQLPFSGEQQFTNKSSDQATDWYDELMHWPIGLLITVSTIAIRNHLLPYNFNIIRCTFIYG